MRKSLVAVALVGGLSGCGEMPTAPSVATPLIPTPLAFHNYSGVPISGKYIVRFKDTESDVVGRGQQIERLYGAKVERTYSTALKGVSVQIADAAAGALSSDPSILTVEQDQDVSLNTTQNGATWGLDRIDQRNRPLSGSYTYLGDGSGVTVYIIDTGINFTHTEYAGRASAGIDEVTIGGTAADCNGHGSHVSGTVGGATYGVAKNVHLVAVRVLDCTGSGTISGVIAGIDWVAQHRTMPAVANMSLGGGLSPTLNLSVQNAVASGVVFAIAAGNSNADACQSSPSSVATGITVGATDIADVFASFSNFGSCVHINAPGVGITSAWIGSNTATNTISGTSMATPHVAGAAALYLQGNPSASPAQVRAALTGNATSGLITGNLNGTPNLLLYTGFMSAPAAPSASFSSNCAALACSFNASASTSSWPAPTYNWSFGDGATGSGKTTSHTYGSAGSFTVQLTVTDPNGTGTRSSIIVVAGAGNHAPAAAITAPTPNASFATGSSISFTGSGSDIEDGTLTGSSLVWTSSVDGQIGTGASFTKSSLSIGTHIITLTAKDSQGATGTATVTITVTASGGGNQPPAANFVFNCTGLLPHQCQFDASSSSDDVGVVLFAWVWGNGRGESHPGPLAKNSWPSPGTYTVTLTVTDGGGLTNSISKSVIVPNLPPTAFITSPAAGSFAQGAAISFAGIGNDTEDGSLSGTSLKWTSSRDGQIGTGTSFSSSTLSAGTHVITLTATDALGATGSASVTIGITAASNQPPTAGISAPTNNASFTSGASVSFAGTGTDPEDGGLSGASLVWTSSLNGQIGTGTSFSTSTLSVGTHTITLTATDSKGATGTATRTITIVAPNQPPTAGISAPTNNASFTSGASVSFAGTGTDPEDGGLSGASLVWTSSLNGQIGTGTSFSTSALSVGTHTITLTATDSKGATGTAIMSITISVPVNQPPVAIFSVTCPVPGLAVPHACTLDATSSTDDNGVVSWVWSFSNSADHPAAQVQKHNFGSAGQYTVTLTVADAGGLTSSLSKVIAVP